MSDSLIATLGVIEAGATPKIGWRLTPAGGPNLMSFACGTTDADLTGAVIASAGPVDKSSPRFALKFQASKGEQLPASFEGGASSLLTLSSAIGGEPAGLTMHAFLANLEALEIKAIE